MLTTFSGGISSASGVALRIALSDRRGIYRPGEKVTGDVIIEAKEDLPICGKSPTLVTRGVHPTKSMIAYSPSFHKIRKCPLFHENF